jgi:hypothetical protein
VRSLGLVAVCAVVGLAGCGSYWDLRKGESLAVGCAGQLNWYPDADGDQWGDPGSTPTPSCVPDEAHGLTASNDLDCDDSDPDITGKAGAICPSQMVDGAATCVAGVRQGGSEYVATCDETPLTEFAQAEQDCAAWAGTETPEAVANGRDGHRGLAALKTEFESNSIQDWLAPRIGGTPTAIWTDLRWSGTLDDGQWQWDDGSLPTYLAPCGGVEPKPADFWPELVPGVPESDAAVEAHLGDVRLALVFDGTGWCRGVPTAAGSAYGPRTAYTLCERPSPDLADYESAPDDAGPVPNPDR